MTAQLWVPGPLPSLNDLIEACKGKNGRGKAYSRLKKTWTDTVWARCKEQRMPRFPGRVFIEFFWIVPDRRTDADNVCAGGRKMVLDGLVAAQVIEDDGWDYARNWTDTFLLVDDVPGRREPGVIARISDATAQGGAST